MSTDIKINKTRKRKEEKAEYTIFVTIAKFLSEGGKLRKGREIFMRYHDGRGYYLCSRYVKKKGHSLIAINAQASYPLNEFVYYVEIACKPIYK